MNSLCAKNILLFVFFCCSLSQPFPVQSQALAPPIPIELFFGNKQLYFQLVVKKKFTPQSKFNFFTVATYTATYNHTEDYSIVMPVQFSYDLGKGFGIMAGTDINSEVGLAPIIGPQFNYVSKTFLAVTVASIFLNEDSDFKMFGLYEYKPPINEKLSLYTRLQFIYNHSWNLGTHNHSYLYLRAGLKRNNFIFGAATNLEQSGSNKELDENYGVFVRWEFR